MDVAKAEEMNCDSENFAPEYRDRLRTWLEKMINSGSIPGLCWENKEQTIFRMPWKHAGRQDYNLEEDSKIFMAWAIHSGRYREGIDKPEPIVWKTRLRCALNKMPDIRELPERSRLDISEPYRVYQLLPPVHKASQIRRRLYKRSQSHESDHSKSYGEHSRAISLVNIPENDKEWTKQAAMQRRNSSIETTTLSLLKPRASPLKSTTPTARRPELWLPTQSVMPLKFPISNGLAGGIHFPQHLPLDSTGPQYPIMPSLPNPFVNFTSSAIPPFFTNPASLDILKRSSLISSTMTSPQKYQEHLSNLTKQLKKDSTLYSEKATAQVNEISKENALSSKLCSRSDEASTKFAKIEASDENASKNSFSLSKLFPSYKYPADIASIQAQLNEYQHKVESLERDLEQSRSAHAKERRAREELEKEKEKMKVSLEHLETIFQPSSNYFQASFTDNRECKTASQYDMAQVLKSYERYHNILRPDESHSLCDQMPNLLMQPSTFPFIENFQSKQRKRKTSSSDDDLAQTKRLLSPLDLTVAISEKKRKTSRDDDDRHSICSDKCSSPPATFVHSAFVTSTSSRVLSNTDDKRFMMSPSSTSSNSPDNVGSRSSKGKNNFSGTSLSPIQRNSGLLTGYSQRPGTIQVT